ncbi:hypothetical protein ZWY2020_000879 [Hordeum vulgare]|nr:hypothetical protein ZWY2020_000879 [Hordeum vulgare]
MGLIFGKAPSPCPDLPPDRAGLIRGKAPSPWLDLPPDLAGLILGRLTSHADHLSFGAVCRSWRLAVQHQLPTRGATPWLNLSPGTYQSLDGNVLCFGRCCHGSSGGWILCCHDNIHGGGGWCLYLRNPFHASDALIEILWHCKEPSKIVMCSSFVTILDGGTFMIAPLWPADLSGGRLLTGDDYVDMASYRGKIFTVTHSGELFSHDLARHRCEHVMKMSPSVQPVNNTVCHLVVSADKKKLLMVRWSRKAMCVVADDQRRAMNLQVFEACLPKVQWLEVKDLGGQVLFLSTSCCRAFGSPEQCHPRFPQGNCVYILGVDWHLKRTVAGASSCKCHECRHVSIPSYCVYDMNTCTVSLVSLGGGHQLESARSEWFFPCE